jgi:hypothetical protein
MTAGMLTLSLPEGSPQQHVDQVVSFGSGTGEPRGASRHKGPLKRDPASERPRMPGGKRLRRDQIEARRLSQPQNAALWDAE